MRQFGPGEDKRARDIRLQLLQFTNMMIEPLLKVYFLLFLLFFLFFLSSFILLIFFILRYQMLRPKLEKQTDNILKQECTAEPEDDDGILHTHAPQDLFSAIDRFVNLTVDQYACVLAIRQCFFFHLC